MKVNKDFIKVMGFMKKKAPVYFSFMIVHNAIVSICYNIVLAFILKEMIDSIVYQDINSIYKAFFIALISFSIAFIFEPITMKITNYCVRSRMGEIRQKTFNHIEDVKVNIYEQYSLGDILSRLSKDTDTLEDIYLKYLPNLCFSVIHGAVAIVSMIFMSPFLGAAALAIGLLSVFVNCLFSKKIRLYSTVYQKEYGNLSQSIIDMNDGFIDMKTSCSEDYFCKKFKNINIKMKDNYEKREKYNLSLETSNTLFENINNIGLMALGLYMVLKGYTTIGVVVSIIRLQGNASYLFSNFSTFIAGLQKALPAARRVMEIFEMETEGQNDDTNILEEKWKISKGQISIKDLTYSYNGVHNILDRISMDINHGDLVGIMGESGEGKSTLIKILLGFYEPATGIYRINDNDIKDINISELRNNIAYVDQDCHLYQLTIEENIRLGNKNASKEEIYEACRLANAHDFILKLENEYDTIINETGDNISGGQRQRIAIARALVSKRNILLIDEGTAELDPETEKIIINTIMNVAGKKTIIIISHKLSFIEHANKKYRLANGKLNYLS